MRNILPLIAVGGAIALLFFTNSAKKLLNLLVSVSNLRIGNVAGGQLPVLLTVDIINPNKQNVVISSINGVLFNGSTALVNFSHDINITAKGNSEKTTIKDLRFNIPLAKTLLDTITNLVKGSNAKYTVKGTLYAENLQIPFNQTLNAN